MAALSGTGGGVFAVAWAAIFIRVATALELLGGMVILAGIYICSRAEAAGDVG